MRRVCAGARPRYACTCRIRDPGTRRHVRSVETGHVKVGHVLLKRQTVRRAGRDATVIILLRAVRFSTTGHCRRDKSHNDLIARAYVLCEVGRASVSRALTRVGRGRIDDKKKFLKTGPHTETRVMILRAFACFVRLSL